METDPKIPTTAALSKILEKTWIDDDRRKKRRRLINHVNAFIEDGEAWSEYQPVPSTFDPASDALFAAMTTPPSDARKTLIDTMIVALKAAGIWTKLDVLWVMAAADAQAGNLNWKNPGSQTLTPTNTTFTADRGQAGNGTTAHIPTGVNFATLGGNYTLNSAQFGICINVAQTTDAALMVSGSTFRMAATNAANAPNGRINDGTGLTSAAGASAAGNMISLRRTGASLRQFFTNGTQVANDTVAATALPTTFTLLAAAGGASSWSNARLSMAYGGGALTDGQMTDLHTITRAYLSAIGA